MENSSSYTICMVCQKLLKRQVLGSNILYYCRNCGYLISEAHLSNETETCSPIDPLTVHVPSSAVAFKLSEDL